MKLVTTFVILLPVLAGLAILSRKHFSKYKGELWLMPQVTGRLQKMEVLHGRSLEDAARQYIERLYRSFLILLAVLWFAALGILMIPASDPAAGSVKRPESGKSEVELQLMDGENTETFRLTVSPREMTEEEFQEAAEKAILGLRQTMKGENADLQHVTQNLILPARDPGGKLDIKWTTGNPVIISRNGTVRREDLENEAHVTVKAVLTDGKRETEMEEDVTVLPFSATESTIDKAIRELKQLEEKSRKEDTLLLPDEVDSVTIKEEKKTVKDLISRVYVILFFLAGFIFIHRFSKEKEKMKQRDELLNRVFYRFSRRLTLLIAAGETLQNALLRAAAVEKNYLLPEVQYTLNCMGTGSSEASCYVRLGRTLGLKNYIRLFSTISTAGPRGSSQLLVLLEQEVRDAENEARDEARKRGERAQEKLLFPMFLLLIVVIGIVIYPAIAGM